MKIEIEISDQDAACIAANYDLPPAVAIKAMAENNAATFRRQFPEAVQYAKDKLREFHPSPKTPLA